MMVLSYTICLFKILELNEIKEKPVEEKNERENFARN
jgi:hypothetical protein